MSSRVRVALFAVAAGTCLGALSCSPAEPTAGPRLGRAHGAIQGGKTDSTHTFAVAVDSDGGTCSGTLIAPNLVLTARHCISFSGGEEVDCSTDEFGRVYSASRFRVTTDAVVTSGATFHAVASILTPPAKEFCGNDIALLLLGDNVAPEEAQPAAPVVDSMTDAATSIPKQRELASSSRAEPGVAGIVVAFERRGRQRQLRETAQRDELGGQVTPDRQGVAIVDHALREPSFEVFDGFLGRAQVGFDGSDDLGSAGNAGRFTDAKDGGAGCPNGEPEDERRQHGQKTDRQGEEPG